MIRSRDIRFIAFAFAVAFVTAPCIADAETQPAPPSVDAATPAEAATCSDTSPTSAERAAREAKLADLGRRLHAEAAIQRDMHVLNRTGLNYSDRRPQPPAQAPAPTQP